MIKELNIKSVFFTLGFLFSISCFSQYEFKKITMSDGLSLDIISCIGEDKDGLLYFGTGNGLNIYDGNSIKTLNTSKLEGFGQHIKKTISISSSKILIATLDKGLFLYNKEIRTIEKIRLTLNKDILNLPILSMHDDKGGKIWIGTSNNGLYSIEKNEVLTFNKDITIPCKRYIGLDNCEINSIESSDERIWFGTRLKGLFSISKNNSHNPKITPSAILLSSQNIWCIKIYGDTLYVGTEDGLNVFNLITKKHQIFLKETENSELSNNIIRAISRDSNGTVWVGTQEDGLYSMQFSNDKVNLNHYKNIPTNSNTLNINKILSLYTDRQDNLWIGTWNGGVNLLNIHSQQFLNVRNKGKANDLSENMIWSLEVGNNDSFWLGSHGSGLCYFEKDNSFFTEEKSSKSLNSISHLYSDTDNNILWIGTWGNGLKAFSNPKMKPLFENIFENTLLKSDRIYEIVKDKHGIIWVGSVTHGVFSINLKNFKQPIVKHFKDFNGYNNETGLSSAEIRTIIPTKNNTLWIGSLTSGLFKVHTDNLGNIIETKSIDLNRTQSKSNVKIKNLFLDSHNQLWIGQYDGTINLFDLHTETIKIFNQSQKNITSGFTEDLLGNIWIATYNGLLKYDPKDRSTTTYLPEISFYTLLNDSKNNQILAGSNKGLYTFNPSTLKEDPYYPSAIFSDLKIFNEIIIPGTKISKDNYLKKTINRTDTLILPFLKNVFSIDITSLSYASQNKNIIKYQLENFENTWNKKNGSATTVEYTNLQPDTYVFKVKTANKDNIWNPETRKLTIIILPPWWKTNWAYFVYVLLIILFGYLITSIIRARIKDNQSLKIEKIKKEQNDILNEQKLSFFTNISHEFRTPLTLILGPLENIIGKTKKGTLLHRQLEMMEKNTNLLLQLVNQVLDFRKFEKHKTSLNVVRIHLNEFVVQTLGQFEGKASQKNISIQFSSKKQNITLWADEDLFRKILLNLLSNAIKYTDSGGWIQISIDESSQFIRLSVKDNGKGIQKKSLPKIFERFYQSGENTQGSTGIGLSLVKEMVELHKGTIKVESQLSKGSEFVIDFLSGNDHFDSDDFKPENIITLEEDVPDVLNSLDVSTTNKKPSILIIDDNDDIRQFVVDNLSSDFNTFDYNNATDALAFAKTKDLALIICDIMMPGMNGIQFCEHIKTDLKTSHIPVILLTAKTADESKIEGYNKGADEYITKPFNTKILISRVHNLIEQRENLKKKIKTLNLEPSKISPTSLDEQFLAKAIKYIEENISNHEYSIDSLSASMGLSHDNFYRKIKNLSGMSATQFIRMIKLKRAAQMLDNTDYSVSEILYEVGFTNPSYFTKCFKHQFGISPTKYKEKD